MSAKNRSTTGIAQPLEDNVILVSRTDKKGKIIDANHPFISISGYSESELVGSPHNIVRHPDMPKEAFADLWSKLKAGRPWLGYVKNRCKNGDHYWVEANVSPRYENGNVIGHLSVRSKPSPQAVDAAERLYADIRDGKASLHPGGPLAKLKRLWRDASSWTLIALLCLPLTAAVWLPATLDLGLGGTGGVFAAALVYLGAILAWLKGRVFSPLQGMRTAMRRMSEFQFEDQFDIERNDEIGRTLQSLKVMQNNQRAAVAAQQALTEEGLRLKSGLDSVQSCVMLVDADLKILYVNPALKQLLTSNEGAIKEVLPVFDAHNLVGTNIDIFHANPSHQRRILESLQSTYEANILVGPLRLVVTATPITDQQGKRVGIITEWQDRTAEVLVEEEIKSIVADIRHGNLTRTISLADKSGFFLALAQEINEMIKVISSSFEDIANTMKSVAGGDLTKVITQARDGTYGEIQNDINTTIEHLKDTIDQVIRSSDFFQKTAEQIVRGNSDLSHRTDEQASTLQETAAAMSQLTDTVQNNADNAAQANELASSAQDTAKRGGDVVKQAVLAMEEINRSSEKIEEITGVIDEIAFQTNLLALNASVEAARAGGHGQGFAVVATEVRSLASRSAQAAKEIKDLITDSGAKVQNGSQLVLNSGETLSDIVDSVSQVGGIISEIATASREQSAGLVEINQAVASLDEMTQKNAALAESVTGSSRESQDKASEIVHLVEFFKTH